MLGAGLIAYHALEQFHFFVEVADQSFPEWAPDGQAGIRG